MQPLIPPKQYTQYHLRELVQRTLKECEQTGLIKTVKNPNPAPDEPENWKIIKNSDAIADHISKTIIGELLELEILRRWAPIFREFRRTDADLGFLAALQSDHDKMIGMRVKEE